MPKRGTFRNPIYIGDRFGKLTVAEGPFYEKMPCGIFRQNWLCRCECGKDHKVAHGNLRNGSTQSCGCYQSERRGKTLRLHGESKKSREWMAWVGMKGRCRNTNHPDFKSYGARGITVCERWLTSYSNFLEDMGRKPSPRHSLERKDVHGPYSPDNCRWATPEEQALNKSNTIRLTLNGETLPLVEWSRRVGINEKVLRRRRRNGWSDERALTTPLSNTANRIYKLP